MLFTINNAVSGLVIGAYVAGTPEEALTAMAREAGFQTYAELDRRSPSAPGELLVVPTAIRLDAAAAGNTHAVYINDELVGHVHQRPDHTTFVHLGSEQRVPMGRVVLTGDPAAPTAGATEPSAPESSVGADAPSGAPLPPPRSCEEMLREIANLVLRDRNLDVARQWMGEPPGPGPSSPPLLSISAATPAVPAPVAAGGPTTVTNLRPPASSSGGGSAELLAWAERLLPLWPDIERVLETALKSSVAGRCR